jgi:threonine/homoserine/homoserine lactone efflux protein
MDPLFLSNLALVAWIGLIGAISPGPDFVIVTKNSLTASRAAGLYTAIEVSLGVLLHLAYCLIGIQFALAESILLFNGIKYGGAAYLVYFLCASSSFKDKDFIQTKQELAPLKALWIGFLTNALNPKAILFFLSIFSQRSRHIQ